MLAFDGLASGGGGNGASALIVLAIAAIALLFWAVASNKPPDAPAWSKARAVNSKQLRRDVNAAFIWTRGFLFRPRVWFVATGCPPMSLTVDGYRTMAVEQASVPQQVARSDFRAWWWFEDDFYWDSADYSPQDVLALLRDRDRKETQKLQRAHMMLNAEQNVSGNRRQPISRELRRLVYERDGGQCTECGSRFDLQYDHVIPVALGGATSFENLQLLCSPCNQEKAAMI